LFVCYRTHKGSINRLLLQTEQFTWEDLPLWDESGTSTMARFIPLIYKMIKYVPWTLIVPHSIHMMLRGIGAENLGIEMWIPFDATPSPLHEFIVLLQVRTFKILSFRLFIPLSYNLAVKYKTMTHLQVTLVAVYPCGGGLEYPHRSPANRKRRRNENRFPRDITGPSRSWGI
jgi:hypothetical protein